VARVAVRNGCVRIVAHVRLLGQEPISPGAAGCLVAGAHESDALLAAHLAAHVTQHAGLTVAGQPGPQVRQARPLGLGYQGFSADRLSI
jgi:hypothetical protein